MGAQAQFQKIHDFAGVDGLNPTAALVEGSDGALYGTTRYGGENDAGIVFKLKKDGTGFRALHMFRFSDPDNGAEPHTGLLEGSDGALYGTTYRGGGGDCYSDGCGTVFKINKDGTGFLLLHEFDGLDGWLPLAVLIEGSDGALYGTTSQTLGGPGFWGGIFKINKEGTGFQKLHDFDFVNGAHPFTGVIEGSNGSLYGTASLGGAHSSGIVFKIEKDGTGFQTLHNFDYYDAENGGHPGNELIEGSDGALYGTTMQGGEHDEDIISEGVVFTLNRDGSGFRKLHDFDYLDFFDGAYPQGGLVEGSDGALYGVTSRGGDQRDYGGIVFKIEKDGTGFQKLHDFDYFDPENGYDPSAGLVEGSEGAFYGTTRYGGVRMDGIVFRLALGCEASVQVQGDGNTAGTIVPVQVYIAHHRPKTVTVRWKLSLLDGSGQAIAEHISPPHTFKPGDVLDQEVKFQLPDDLASGEYTLDLAIKQMAGTKGATTTFRIIRAE